MLEDCCSDELKIDPSYSDIPVEELAPVMQDEWESDWDQRETDSPQ